MLCLTDSWVSGCTAVFSLGFSPGSSPVVSQYPACLHSSTSLSSSGTAWTTATATSQASRAVASITGFHCDLDTLIQLHLHSIGFLERKINSLSAATAAFQNIGKILLLKSDVSWTHLASACKLPMNSYKILKCAHYLEDYSWCAVSS